MARKDETDSRHVFNFMNETGMIRQPGDEKTRHDYKQLADEKGLTTSEERSSITPLTRSSTIKNAKGVLKEFRAFARTHGFGDNLRTLPAASVRAFLDHKVVDDGIGRQRAADIVSVINKAGYFGGNSAFNTAAAEYRKDVLPHVPSNPAVSRAFSDPKAVIANIQNPRAALAAEIQLKTGLRADNALNFKINQSGDSVSFTSKGGMPHAEYKLPPDLIARARVFADASGKVSLMPYRSYATIIHNAAAACGERIDIGNGKTKVLNSHAFRHAYAKAAYAEYKRQGLSDTEAKARVSEDLFHKRLDIVEIYIK